MCHALKRETVRGFWPENLKETAWKIRMYMVGYSSSGYKIMIRGLVVDSFGSAQIQVTGFCEYGNEPLHPMNYGEFSD